MRTLTSLDLQGEPYTFSHLLFVSRTYYLSPDEESALANSSSARTASRRKNGGKKSRPSLRVGDEAAPPEDRIYSYHPEDDVIKEVSVYFVFDALLVRLMIPLPSLPRTP